MRLGEKMPDKKIIKLQKKSNKIKKRKRSIYQLLFMLIITLSLIIILTAPVFAIKTVNIEGNTYFSDDDIKKMLGIDGKTNVFFFIAENVFYNDKTLSPYISNLSINLDFPNEISIQVDEREVVGYVPYLGTYLCIDKEGRVINTSLFIDEDVPIITGLDLDGFGMNTILDANDEELFIQLVQLISHLVKYELLDDIIKIDCSNVTKIKLYTKDVEILFGSTEEMNKKVNIIVQALKEVEKLRGILDVSELNQPITFKKS